MAGTESPNRSSPRETELAESLAGYDDAAVSEAVAREALRRLDEFAEGVTRYRRFPRLEAPEPAPIAWRRGSARLLDFGTFSGAKSGEPLLVVPSLINRWNILDLSDDRSLLRYLAEQGFRPFVVDWGAPSEAERGFTLTDYVAGYLADMLRYIRAETDGKPAVIGYCMGGLLALALVLRNQADTRSLALLATPWNFHAEPTHLPLLEAMAPTLETMIATLDELPVDIIQAMFAGLDPTMTGRKFRRFARTQLQGDAARRFVRLEDWLNDGVSLAGPVARECLLGWYLRNEPCSKAWRLDGRVVEPEGLERPSLAVIPDRDHIVPPASAAALADALPTAEVMHLPTGHIGMVAGGNARELLYAPLAAWLVTN